MICVVFLGESIMKDGEVKRGLKKTNKNTPIVGRHFLCRGHKTNTNKMCSRG